MKLVIAFAAGAMFSVGLVVAGMTRPGKVLAFLDLAGAWDPSLAFVMVGAIGVQFWAWRLVPSLPRPWAAERFHLPTRTDLDARLLAGAALFGIGWGLGGYCPGPALTSLGAGAADSVLFGVSLLAGMAIWRGVEALGWARS
ncbi:MAG: hypothetical protein RLZZ383_1191 [Pseudomonadota bacterium]|jgi:uncharacterized membrane protein YedE/YeeE